MQIVDVGEKLLDQTLAGLKCTRHHAEEYSCVSHFDSLDEQLSLLRLGKWPSLAKRNSEPLSRQAEKEVPEIEGKV